MLVHRFWTIFFNPKMRQINDLPWSNTTNLTITIPFTSISAITTQESSSRSNQNLSTPTRSSLQMSTTLSRQDFQSSTTLISGAAQLSLVHGNPHMDVNKNVFKFSVISLSIPPKYATILFWRALDYSEHFCFLSSVSLLRLYPRIC